jgi:hypothetical protein
MVNGMGRVWGVPGLKAFRMFDGEPELKTSTEMEK